MREPHRQAGASPIESGTKSPNAIKMDVEGYELEMLEGFGPTLASRAPRVVGVEVHFGILRDRGMQNAPRQIEALLQRLRISRRMA
jgi:Methyltransferase FkbM domain